LSSYTEIQKFGDLIFDHPSLFLENYPISVINATKSSGLATKFALRLKKYGFNIPDEASVTNTKDEHPETKIYHRYDTTTQLGVSIDSATIDSLTQFVPGKIEEE